MSEYAQRSGTRPSRADAVRAWTRHASQLASSSPASRPGPPAHETWHAALNQTPPLQAVAQLHCALNRSARVAHVAQLSSALQGKPREIVQGKLETLQRDGIEDEELLQGKFETAQRGEEDEEPLRATPGDLISSRARRRAEEELPNVAPAGTADPVARLMPGPGITQRYIDVMQEDVFERENEREFLLSSGMLGKYSQVQVFLSDISRTKPLLDQLNAELLLKPRRTLSQVLRARETDGEELHQLIAGVNAEDFSGLVARGIRFEDWVDSSHGVQTHRIQWFMIEQEFGPKAKKLYKSSVDEIWRVRGKYGTTLWDLIVDSTKANDDHDFTKPEKLQKYLRETYIPEIAKLKNALRSSIEEEEAGFQAAKSHLGKDAPEIRQEEKPEPRESERGTWKGWKKSVEDGNTVWRPTIFIPRSR